MNSPLLVTAGLTAGYGPAPVLHDVDLHVDAGEVVAVLGTNGAGKTTLLRALSGMISSKGVVDLAGRDLTRLSPEAIVGEGVAHVPQGRGTFPRLSVEENLRLGAFRRRDSHIEEEIDQWCEIFPQLGRRRSQPAGHLSGGEQQMLALSRGLMSHPRLLLLDEPSLGLAPIVTQGLFERLAVLKAEGEVAILLVEQNAMLALDLATRAYIVESGRIGSHGPADQFRDEDTVRRSYMGS